MAKLLDKLYENNINHTLSYLIAIEKEIKANNCELGVEEDTTLLTIFDNKPSIITIDKVRYHEFKDSGIIELHVCKNGKKKVDVWVRSVDHFGYRLDLVYNKIIWDGGVSDYINAYEVKRAYILENFDIINTGADVNHTYNFVDAMYDYLDTVSEYHIKSWSNKLALKGFYRYFKRFSKKYIET